MRFGKCWRKPARAAGAEAELAETAVERLQKVNLIERQIDCKGDVVHALPALSTPLMRSWSWRDGYAAFRLRA